MEGFLSLGEVKNRASTVMSDAPALPVAPDVRKSSGKKRGSTSKKRMLFRPREPPVNIDQDLFRNPITRKDSAETIPAVE